MTDASQSGLAIIAGAGDLPRLLAEECARTDRAYTVVGFGNAALKWAVDHPLITAQFEKPASLFKALKKQGCSQVVFAGAMTRPQLNPLKFDFKMLKLASSLLPALKNGDDVTLRAITTIFESEGFQIIGADSVLTSLLCTRGCPTKAQPSDADMADIKRGFDIVAAMGSVDVGQAAVVAGGICLGVETIQGTDALLKFVATTSEPYIKDQKGVLVKGVKPDQSRLVDMPTIGIQTILSAEAAGLSGVSLPHKGALILDQDAVVKIADEAGLFLYVHDAKDVS